MKEKMVLNIAEAAELIGVSVPIMHQLAKENDFPAFRAGKRWLIPRSSLEQWVIECANKRRTFCTKGVMENES